MTLLAAIDRLYEAVVGDPHAWTEQAFVDWSTEVGSEPIGKRERRALRQVLRAADKLRRFWLDPAAPSAVHEWRSRVDLVLGPRAWRPTLDIAMAGLATSPDPELFAEVQARFRLVNGDVWLDGVSYEEWLADRENT